MSTELELIPTQPVVVPVEVAAFIKGDKGATGGVTPELQQLADDAQVAAEQAEASAANATSASTTAQASAATATTQAGIGAAANNIYPTSAAGVAGGSGVASGKYFYVPSTDALGSYDVWLNNAGVATTSGITLPNLAAVQALQTLVGDISGADSIIRDTVGHVVLKLTQDGTFNIPALATEGFAADEIGASATQISIPNGGTIKAGQESSQDITDPNGLCAAQVDSTGRYLLADALIDRQFRGAWQAVQSTLDYEINHVLAYGQSWACGFDAIPALSTTQLHDTIMFNGGIRQQYSIAERPTALQSFVPAIESTDVGTPEFPTSNVGETGAVAMAKTIKELIKLENNLDFAQQGYQLLVSAPGEGSKTIEELSNEAMPYINRVYEQIDRGFALAQAAGKTYAVQTITWMQGSNEVQGAGYAAQLEALRLQISNHAKAVTGQTKEVVLITWQLMPQSDLVTEQRSAKGVYDRFVVAADTYPYIVCSGPSYQVDMISGTNVHIRPGGMIQIGEAMGLAYKRVIIGGHLADFQPLRPIALTRQGSVATLTLNVVDGFLVNDTELVSAIANSGFNLYTSAGALLPISSVTLLGSRRIKIVAAAPIPSGAVLRYADTGVDFAPATKWRGNIRDNYYKSAGVNRWLVAFSFDFQN